MTIMPTIDDDYIRTVYDTLSNMDVDLDGDPLQFGPKRLNGKVAACRRHLTRCQQIYLQLADDLQRLNREHRRAKLDYDMALQDLLTNDPSVRSGSSVRDREAIAGTRLRAEREYVSSLEASQGDVETILQVVKAKREDLKDVQGRIRDQIKLCQEEIGLGGMWGSAPPPDTKTRVDLDARPRVDTGAMEDLNRIARAINEDVSMSDLEAYVASETDSPDAVAAVEAFVEAVETSPGIVLVEEAVVVEETVVVEAAPVVEPVVVIEDTIPDVSELPVIEEKAAPVATAEASAIDGFLDEVDVTAPVPAPLPGTSVAAEIDFDDLIGSLV